MFLVSGYLDQGLLVHDAVRLRKNYFSKKHWYFDFLSVLPTDILYFWWENSDCDEKVPCPTIVRINRLFRLPRLWEWCERTETATSYPNAFRICKVNENCINYHNIRIKFASNDKFNDNDLISGFIMLLGCISNSCIDPLECMLLFCIKLCTWVWFR